MGGKKVTGFAVRVSTPDGDMYLRHGSRPGRGPVVKHATSEEALHAFKVIAPGLEPDEHACVVPYDQIPREELNP